MYIQQNMTFFTCHLIARRHSLLLFVGLCLVECLSFCCLVLTTDSIGYEPAVRTRLSDRCVAVATEESTLKYTFVILYLSISVTHYYNFY